MPTGKDKVDGSKRNAKAAPKKKKGKRSPKTKQANMSTASAPVLARENDERVAEKRVALMREKLKKSMEDPEMRDQIVRAIRTMLNEGQR